MKGSTSLEANTAATEAHPWAAPLSPLSFLTRSATVWADRPAVQLVDHVLTYRDHHERVLRAAGYLRDIGVGAGDRVAALMPNLPQMLELHYAVPGLGAVLVPLNTRLSASEYAYILGHSGARCIVVATSLHEVANQALESMGKDAPQPIWVANGSPAPDLAEEYEKGLESADAAQLTEPLDELSMLSLNYTSGTTGKPKGVMTNHRGAYLHSLGVIAEAGLTTRSAYLWTLPMFHCNGWAYTWAVTATGAKHVCLPAIDPDEIWRAIHQDGITHFCAAPTVVTMLLASKSAAPCPHPVRLFVGGSPPSPTLLEQAERLNLEITHLYGLTESYGPVAVCAWNPSWDRLDREQQARLKARQGVGTVVTQPLRIVDEKMRDLPWDGESAGEIVIRGNNVMMGYYRDPESTAKAFEGGWFHTGDIGVMHSDGYIELRDRLKDIVISGGENIATVEVEQALQAHPGVLEVAVVGAPDEKWGELVTAFVVPTSEAEPPTADQLLEFARERLARMKVPRRIEIIDQLPKTGTGKIQKFRLREMLTQDPMESA